jgi:hypothetical protein
MMPTKTSVGPDEVVRLEVLRLAPPLRSAARHWAALRRYLEQCNALWTQRQQATKVCHTIPI